VKAYLFGHNHVWEVTRRGGVHLVSLPATAYVFSGSQRSAWVDLWLGRDGARLDVRPVQGGGEAEGLSAVLRWA
jgi:hypothetical protein